MFIVSKISFDQEPTAAVAASQRDLTAPAAHITPFQAKGKSARVIIIDRQTPTLARALVTTSFSQFPVIGHSR